MKDSRPALSTRSTFLERARGKVTKEVSHAMSLHKEGYTFRKIGGTLRKEAKHSSGKSIISRIKRRNRTTGVAQWSTSKPIKETIFASNLTEHKRAQSLCKTSASRVVLRIWSNKGCSQREAKYANKVHQITSQSVIGPRNGDQTGNYQGNRFRVFTSMSQNINVWRSHWAEEIFGRASNCFGPPRGYCNKNTCCEIRQECLEQCIQCSRLKLPRVR